MRYHVDIFIYGSTSIREAKGSDICLGLEFQKCDYMLPVMVTKDL